MNEEIILNMVERSVQDNAITYDDFDEIFKLLSLKEQYDVVDILYKYGIDLVDQKDTGYLLDTGEDDLDEGEEEQTENHEYYDDAIFKDNQIDEEDYPLPVYQDIRQSNQVLCALIQEGNKQAYQDLCVKNEKLVEKYANLYRKKYKISLDFEDLKQVGFMGLIRAAKKFDLDQGTAFSTYAVWWVKQAISREIMDHGYSIRIPVHMHERINKVIAVDRDLENENADISERIELIADRTGLAERDVKECLYLKTNVLTTASLNAPVGSDDDGTTLIEFLPQETTESVEDTVGKKELRRTLEAAMERALSEREQTILRLRFGWEDGNVRTLEEIGQMYDLTRERIRQIESRALRKLNRGPIKRQLFDFIE